MPKGLGNLIMQRFAIPAGPEVGRLRDQLLMAVNEGKLEPNQESEVYLRYLAGVIPERGAGDDD